MKSLKNVTLIGKTDSTPRFAEVSAGLTDRVSRTNPKILGGNSIRNALLSETKHFLDDTIQQ